MPAYVIVDIDVQDLILYEEYKRLAPASIAKYGGKYLARGGATEVLEGVWIPKRFVILQFESVARAKEWVNSPEYAPAKNLRHQCATAHMILTEGL
ncbi:DUF1330 domain-containing protein [bacterium]|nr:DUF1330 domain-containing protein [bacterium]